MPGGFEFIDGSNCKYLEPIDSEYLKIKTSDLVVMHINIRITISKLDELLLVIEKMKEYNCKPHPLILCETFVTANNTNQCSILGYADYHAYRKELWGGGVSMHTRNDVCATVRDDLSIFHEGLMESQTIELQTSYFTVNMLPAWYTCHLVCVRLSYYQALEAAQRKHTFPHFIMLNLD